jgi:hypothetical protein
MKVFGASAIADRVIHLAERFRSKGDGTSFSTKYGQSAERMKWAATSIRDLTVNLADHLKVPVETVRVSYGVGPGARWRWFLSVEQHPYGHIAVSDEMLDVAVEDLETHLSAARAVYEET